MFRLIELLIATVFFVGADIPGYTAIYYGSTTIKKAYVGSTLVYGNTVQTREVAWYQCDDSAASGIVVDSSSRKQNALSEYNTSDISVLGKVGMALRYDNTTLNDKFLHVGSTAAIQAISGNQWSVCFWTKYTWNYSALINANPKFWFFFRDGIVYYWGGQEINTYDAWTTDEWVHWALVGSGDTFTAYFNGVPLFVNTIDGAATLPMSTVPILMAGSSYWSADIYIDDIRFYDFVLSQSDVDFIYNSGNGSTNPLP